MEAVFTPDGGYIQKELTIAKRFASWHTSYLGKNYPGKKIKECVKITKADGTVFYEKLGGWNWNDF